MRHRIGFAVAVFLGAFLLFLAEPMAGKELLPQFGGAAAVWITCLVWFQVALLAGYGYAHWMARGRGRTFAVHAALLAAAVIVAFFWSAGPGQRYPSGPPALAVCLALTRRIGLPFCLLAATGPLLQAWWARVEGRGVPFRLFGLSNAASLLALLLYPTFIEPHLNLHAQRLAWAAGVALFGLISAWLCWQVSHGRSVTDALPLERLEQQRSTMRNRSLWLLLPLGGALQLTAVTAYLTSNVAAMPLLWVLPLAVYLVSFVLAFQAPGLYRRGLVTKLLVVFGVGLAFQLSRPEVAIPLVFNIALVLLELLFACWFLHAELVVLRPARADEATAFYLMLAGGGAAGSFLVGIVAPLVFRGNYDLALALLLTALLALDVAWHEGWLRRAGWTVAVVSLIVLTVTLHGLYFRDVLVATRNFYGGLRVRQSITQAGDPERTLLSGSIDHGTQIFSDALRRVPTSYYAEDSGIGLALTECCSGGPKRVGVVGLGAGTLAAYGEAGDTMRFYELNPAVEPLATHLFSYLRESRAQVSLVEGDGRAMLAKEAPASFDVIAVDAFTGDAIPMHLLTTQAMMVYRRALRPDGVLAFHVSNQFVDLAPEVAQLARASGMQARQVRSEANPARGELQAEWVLVTTRAGFFDMPGLRGRATIVPGRAGVTAWTDDDSSLWRVVRW
jgi:hypothetical protein